MPFYFTYTQDIVQTRDPLDDGWDCGDEDLQPDGWRVTWASSYNLEGIMLESMVDVPWPESVKHIWVVWNVFTDGDTFGSTSGQVDVVWSGVDQEEAQQAVERAETIDYGYFGSLDHTYIKKFDVSVFDT